MVMVKWSELKCQIDKQISLSLSLSLSLLHPHKVKLCCVLERVSFRNVCKFVPLD